MRKRKQSKTKVIYVRVSPEDHAQIENKADHAGLPVAVYIRELALTQPAKKQRRGAA